LGSERQYMDFFLFKMASPAKLGGKRRAGRERGGGLPCAGDGKKTHPESAGAELRKDNPGDSRDNQNNNDGYYNATRRRYHAFLWGHHARVRVCGTWRFDGGFVVPESIEAQGQGS
jgi:hypothetical protein